MYSKLEWEQFFIAAGIEAAPASRYAKKFVANSIEMEMVLSIENSIEKCFMNKMKTMMMPLLKWV